MKDTRLEATKYIWTAFALAILAIMGGTFLTDSTIGAGHVVMTAVIAGACMIPTIVMWEKGAPVMMSDEHAARKTKRRANVDRLIDRLSDEDRAALFDRLQDEAEEYRYSLSDDGELVNMRR